MSSDTGYTYKHLPITRESERRHLQHSDVLESSEVTLGDACEVIPVQLPAKTDMQRHEILHLHSASDPQPDD